MNEIDLQRKFFSDSADSYDHAHAGDEHEFALSWLSAVIDYYDMNSVLDIGSGTGRAVSALAKKHPTLNVVGIEPVEMLRRKGYEKGLSPEQLRPGDATSLTYDSDSFDVVCEFGALHHIRDCVGAVSEMIRVAKFGVFISDSNNFGHGRLPVRIVKQFLHAAHLWPAATFLQTRGKGYAYSDGDGIAYSYSVFDSVRYLRNKFPIVHHMNTLASGPNLYRSASHVAIFAHR